MTAFKSKGILGSGSSTGIGKTWLALLVAGTAAQAWCSTPNFPGTATLVTQYAMQEAKSRYAEEILRIVQYMQNEYEIKRFPGIHSCGWFALNVDPIYCPPG